MACTHSQWGWTSRRCSTGTRPSAAWPRSGGVRPCGAPGPAPEGLAFSCGPACPGNPRPVTTEQEEGMGWGTTGGGRVLLAGLRGSGRGTGGGARRRMRRRRLRGPRPPMVRANPNPEARLWAMRAPECLRACPSPVAAAPSLVRWALAHWTGSLAAGAPSPFVRRANSNLWVEGIRLGAPPPLPLSPFGTLILKPTFPQWVTLLIQ